MDSGKPLNFRLKLKKNFARIKTILNERKKIRNEYRTHLEEEYIKKKRTEYQDKLT